ncbi:MAG: penicillin-binding protein 1C [Bacteroides sp. SM23_62_1]|nr:MAG: penicillin-binding protein 1C [Bacteroides sp. SM23_62_1]
MIITKHVIVRSILVVISIVILSVFLVSLPDPLFNDPTCTVMEDREGELLGAKIADDGQWRFPYNEHIPGKFEKAIILFEDQYFYYHPGVNPFSLFRALVTNIREGRIVSGGSTITMQVIRLSRKNKPRTISEKIIEILLAIRLELSFSKSEILALYASHAPFGGNVVGLDAASWRYFGCAPEYLSWAEAAMLAVLPNSPSLIHPGRNRDALLIKRNQLLDRLYAKQKIDSVTLVLSRLEPLPEEPLPLPSLAPHLLSRVYFNFRGEKIRTTLSRSLQEKAVQILDGHHNKLMHNKIYNAACIILEVETGEVLAYVGNTQNLDNPEHSSDVDIIISRRSTGSILKPILYCLMLNEGAILPGTLIPDIPTYYSGYTPKNFSHTYDGAVPAKRALARSLNIPAVRMLQQFGLERFYFYLKKLGITTLDFPSEHYGLSLILGGAEGTLWDITGIFCSFARILQNYHENDGRYFQYNIHPPSYITTHPDRLKKDEVKHEITHNNIVKASSIWLTFQSLIEVNRPENEYGWEMFNSSVNIAWKTGTSFGFRDGWAVGTTPDYTIGVWVGNADGEGRPGLTGIQTAAPIMFDLFELLPSESWFETPAEELQLVSVCRQSGHRAGIYCPQTEQILVPQACLNTEPCPYHIMIHLTADGKYRVTKDCNYNNEMYHESWFVLPPVQEWYYKSKHPDYQILPPYHPGCAPEEFIATMDLIYPKQSARIYIPYDLDGKKEQVVLEATHRKSGTVIYWHLDETYIGHTQYIHQLGISPKKGIHTLTLVDEFGNILEKNFEVLDQ